MKKKRKVKLKKKASIISGAVLLIVCFVIILSLLLINKKTLNNIKRNYNKNVIVSKNTKIYDENHKIIGSINKNIKLQLKDDKKLDLNDKYYEVENGDFYVFYKDVKKNNSEEKFQNKYLVFNKNIESKKLVLYKDNKKVLTLNKKVSLPIQYMDDKNYYVEYLGNLLQIKRTSEDKIIDSNNTNEEENSFVSVFDYEIGTCNSCISLDKAKEQLKYVKDNNISVLTIDEYKNWAKGNIRLKENSILWTTDSKDVVKDLPYTLHSYGEDIKFNNVNKVSRRDELNRYVVTNSTDIEVFKQMLNGEEIIEKKQLVFLF